MAKEAVTGANGSSNPAGTAGRRMAVASHTGAQPETPSALVPVDHPHQAGESGSANAKRKRTVEERDNIKKLRKIKACLLCRRLQIRCSGRNPCAACKVLKTAKAGPGSGLGITECHRTLLDSNFFLKDNSLPSIADFPAFRDIGTHSPQEVFYLCFRDLFQYNPALQDTPSLEKLDELYIESLGRYFGKQACVAKAALLKAPTGLNIFIKTNTVLISEAFLGSDVAKMKPYVQILRAFSSMHAFNILKNVVSPDTLRSAKLEHLIKIIVLLALCTEQTLDLIERREQPGSDWSDAERKLQDFIATEMVHHLRYLILTVFTSSSRLLRFVDSRDHQRLLANTFWKDFRDDTIQLVLWPGAGPPPRRQNSKKDVSRRSLALINAADGPWTLTEGSAASESPGNTSSRLTGEQSQIETPRPSHGSFKDILHHSWALEETVAADPLNYKPGVSSKLWTHHWVLQEAVVAGRLRYIPDISSALWDGTAELVTSITSNPTSQPVPQLLLTDPSLDSFSNFGADYESFNLDFPVLEMPDVQGNFDFDIFLNQSGDADFSAGIFDSNSVPDAMKMAEVLGSANKPNTTL